MKCTKGFLCSIYIEFYRMEKAPKSPKLLICECCAFNCITKKDFIRHLLTANIKNCII
jgi:hypothetical protein